MNDVERALQGFKILLEEQLRRQRDLEEKVTPVNYGTKPVLTIGLIEGDGIGPVIMASAEKVLKNLLKEEILTGKIILSHVEGLTLRARLAAGKPLPDGVAAQIRSCDVLLKGPTATPHGGTMESANVALRRTLDLYANLRPVRIPEKKINWTFFRENSEGEYVLGSRGIQVNDGMAVDFKLTTRAGTERIARAAFDYAAKNGNKSVTVVTKANILKKTDGLFSEVARTVAKEYPEIELRERYVDIMAAELIREDTRADYEVFLLPNLYGDILTDEAAQIQGGVGTAGSANIGARFAMFEAIHGTAPRLIEEGLGDYAAPVSILRAGVMLLRHIGRFAQASRLEETLDSFPPDCIPDGTKGRPTCAAFTEALLSRL